MASSTWPRAKAPAGPWTRWRRQSFGIEDGNGAIIGHDRWPAGLSRKPTKALFTRIAAEAMWLRSLTPRAAEFSVTPAKTSYFTRARSQKSTDDSPYEFGAQASGPATYTVLAPRITRDASADTQKRANSGNHLLTIVPTQVHPGLWKQRPLVLSHPRKARARLEGGIHPTMGSIHAPRTRDDRRPCHSWSWPTATILAAFPSRSILQIGQAAIFVL